MTTPRYPCVCCGYLVFDEPPGSYGVCRVCRWEDDLIQLRFPLREGGANRQSLVQCQALFERWGTSELDFEPVPAREVAKYSREASFRRIDLSQDVFENSSGQSLNWPDDRTVLYWWRPTFWLADRRPKEDPQLRE